MNFLRAIALAATAASATLILSTTAVAADAEAAQKLAKESGCTKCHAVDKTKKGPSFQKTAGKYKGKADAETKVTDQITKPQKVKLEDGTEDDHGQVKSKDPAEVKNLVQWILSQ